MADTLITVENFRECFAISEDIAPGRITPHIGSASRRLKKWVGEEAYSDALSETPQDALRQADLKSAEAALAMHFAVAGLNTNITTRGVVKTAREGGTMGGNTVFSYLTPNEVRQLGDVYLDQAEEIARPYALADGTPDAGIEVVSD